MKAAAGNMAPGAEGILRTSLLSEGRVVIVGLGGIGSVVATYLTIFLSALSDLVIRVQLVDGDVFEERNRERMDVPEHGNKALVWSRALSERFGREGLLIRPVDRFVTKENVAHILGEGDICLGCVDNHATRKILGERSEELDDIILISGGNDGVEDGQRGTYGNVQVFRKVGGEAQNPSIFAFHPELRQPRDKPPEVSCVDLAATTAPQILFTNLAVASAMLNAFYRILRADLVEPMYDEACLDILEAKVSPHWLRGQGGVQGPETALQPTLGPCLAEPLRPDRDYP